MTAGSIFVLCFWIWALLTVVQFIYACVYLVFAFFTRTAMEVARIYRQVRGIRPPEDVVPQKTNLNESSQS